MSESMGALGESLFGRSVASSVFSTLDILDFSQRIQRMLRVQRYMLKWAVDVINQSSPCAMESGHCGILCRMTASLQR
jgi:hypothetical protein